MLPSLNQTSTHSSWAIIRTGVNLRPTCIRMRTAAGRLDSEKRFNTRSLPSHVRHGGGGGAEGLSRVVSAWWEKASSRDALTPIPPAFAFFWLA